MRRIKQENIVQVPSEHEHKNPTNAMFCSTCGKSITNNDVQTRYVCPNCRHIAQPLDNFCNSCGVSLETPDVVEHYFTGRLTESDFAKIKPAGKEEL